GGGRARPARRQAGPARPRARHRAAQGAARMGVRERRPRAGRLDAGRERSGAALQRAARVSPCHRQPARRRAAAVIAVRRAESEADYETWARIKTAVVRNEPTTVEHLRKLEDEPGRLLLLADVDGEPVGCGVAGRSSFGGRAFV